MSGRCPGSSGGGVAGWSVCALYPCIRSQPHSRKAFPPCFVGVCGWVVCAKNWQLCWLAPGDILLLTQEERVHGVWLRQECRRARTRVVDSLFQAVEPEARPIRVHHQAERGRRARIARNRNGNDPVLL